MRYHNWKLLLTVAMLAAGMALAGCSQTSAPQSDEQEQEMQEQETPEQAPSGEEPSTDEPSARKTSGQKNIASERPAPPASPAPPAPPAPKRATLAAGTPLVVRTTTTLSTKTVQTGERFTATLEEPIMDGMWMIAPKGALVEGVVAEADKGGKVKGVASLAVRLVGLTTDDGQRIEISTDTRTAQAKQSKKKDAAKVGIGAGIGAAIGAIAGGGKGAAIGAGVGGGAGTAGVLLTTGDPAVIGAESVLNFELTAPVTITARK